MMKRNLMPEQIVFILVENRAPSRSIKIAKIMHEFTEKLGMIFANFLNIGVPDSQTKRKLINISGEKG